MLHSQPGLKNDAAHTLRGFLMGSADVVPGVSGGTVALVTGIYERLVTAISHVDMHLLGCIRRGQWKQAARHIDLRFIIALLVGVAGGFICMTVLMHELITNSFTRGLTFAAFFGMILASSWLVAKMVRLRVLQDAVLPVSLGLIGAAFACWLSTLTRQVDSNAIVSYPYLFLCGSVAICAMILPGISGAMIAMILGVYEYMTAIPGALLDGENVERGLLSVAAFGSGAVISLIAFSKILRKLLERFHEPTMGLLCGLMVGALPMLWPFQVKIADKQYRRFIPEAIDGYVLAAAGIALVAAVFVLAVDRISRVSSRPIMEKGLMEKGHKADEASQQSDASL